MADNIIINAPTVAGGQVVASDDIGGVQHELVKIEYGGDGSATMVDAANPLPVTDAVAEAALASIAAEDFATHTAQIDSSQKTQLVDAAGNAVTVTGNKLDVNATFSGDIEIGAVEIKNSTTDDRTAVINTAPTTEFGLVTRNIPSGTQPVSAASLPLPTGAATAANQQTDALTNTQLRAVPVPVSGTVAVTGAGDATAANQGTQITAEQAIQVAVQIMDDWDESDRAKVNPIAGQAGVQGGAGAVSANTQRVVVSTDQTAIPISAASLPLPSNAAQETGGNLASILTELNTINLGIPGALGQTTMANSMPVVIASNQTPIAVTGSFGGVDNTQIYSGTLSATGAITGIDTTGYIGSVMQLSGVWSGALIVEGSNDNLLWNQLLFTNTNEISQDDVINSNGVFVVKSSAKYIRLNVIELLSGSIVVLILGRTQIAINAADRISLAMDKGNNTPLYVSEIDSKKDISKALVPSDAPAPIYGSASAVNQVMAIIDSAGYNSVSVQLTGTWSGTVVFYYSNDGATWATLVAYLGNSLGATTSIGVNGTYMLPAQGRFIRVMPNAWTSGTVTMVAYLRQQVVIGNLVSQNLTFINGTAPASTGLNGSFVVGGNTAPGSATSVNPVGIAGVDSSNFLRRLLTDTSGRLITSVTDQAGTARPLGGLSPASSIFNVASIAVQDTAQFEGQSLVELLGQMLLELRILNQNISELPIALQSQNGKLDEPALFRNDQSIFAN